MPDEIDRVFSGIPDKDDKGNNTYRFSGASSLYMNGIPKRWNGSAWVNLGGGS